MYHIINRGNYRHDLFINDGAHEAFERCLFESEGLLKEGAFESLRLEGRELREANELRWENLLERMLSTLQKNDNAISSEKKSAQWKVWIAVVLKSHTAATNVWIADQLNMGAPQSVSMLTSRFKQQKQDRAAAYLKFTQNITKWLFSPSPRSTGRS